MRSRVLPLLPLLWLVGCEAGESGGGKCDHAVPSAEAFRKAGESDGVFLLPGGRALTPTGKQVVVGGFPVDVRSHPTLPLAYVSNTGYAFRALQVIDVRSGEIVQQLKRKNAFYGLALSSDGKRLYAAGGDSKLVEAYDVGVDGTLKPSGQVEVGSYPAGIALSADGKTMWVGQFLGMNVVEIDAVALSKTREIPVGFGSYGVAVAERRGELYVTDFRGDKVGVVSLTSGEVSTIRVGGGPLGLSLSPDESLAYVTVSDGHNIVGIDTASKTVVRTVAVGDPDLVDEKGNPLPGSSPSGMALDAAGGKLYVARAADNAITVYNAPTFMAESAIPVGWYPTAVALANGGKTLVVANGKGIGTGPLLGYKKDDESGKEKMTGTVSLIPLDGIDLPALTAQAEQNIRRPGRIFPFACDGPFPVPAKPGGETPIKHVVLIVKENKTYDSVLGDLDRGDRDPSLVLFGEDITPNLHALARRFTVHDNFYNDSETSVQGHLWLTSSFVNDYIERTWLEDYRGASGFGADAAMGAGQPDFGTFFTHLIRHKVTFTNFGEAVGTLGFEGGDFVLNHTDKEFPGVFFNTKVKDEVKALYVAKKLVEEEQFPSFVYLLLPNDHTHGTSPGALSPESMINDNDVAMGIVIEAISRSRFWESTAIFVVEDDPQQGSDHVDYHRSFLLVISPWAKRGHVSSVHTSFPSLFRTFELIFGIPPMNRYDRLATPLWDAFSSKPDPEPYTAVARTVPDVVNPPRAVGADLSMRMDFRGPDRNPLLGDVLWWYRKGSPRPGSRLEQVLKGKGEALDEGDWDDDVERDIYDASWRHLEEYLKRNPKVKADLRPRFRHMGRRR